MRDSIMVPKRAFGRTGAHISQLCLGGGFPDTAETEGLLDQALACGVDCWETTMLFGVQRYREYFRKHQGARERVFLTAKTSSWDPAVMQAHLDKTLQDLDTPCVDFFAIHAVSELAVLGSEVRRWAERAKAEKKVRFFGFCTHKNMDRCLAGAAALGWIDGVQTVYNFRLQHAQAMQDALQACHEKGIGLIAIKSMGLSLGSTSELQALPITEDGLRTKLAGRGMSFEQAKLQTVWQHPAIASICSLMPDTAILRANAQAACAGPMPPDVARLLTDYAECTAPYACTHCGAICEAATPERLPIFDAMYALLFARGYGDRMLAKKSFQRIPLEIRNRLSDCDYTLAEKRCPQHMPIGRLMREAVAELTG